MTFTALPISGHGISTHIGFPTINLSPPQDLLLKKGVHGCTATINDENFSAILYFGPAHIGHQGNTTLEVHLLRPSHKIQKLRLEPHTPITVHPTIFIRPPKNITDPQKMKAQIAEDIHRLEAFLAENTVNNV